MKIDSDTRMVIDDSVVYRKSDHGLDQLAVTHDGQLSPRERQVLILMDGRRTIAELSGFFGPETVWNLAGALEEKGLATRVDQPPRPRRNASARSDAASRSGDPPVPTLRWHRDWFALVNLAMLVLVLVMAGGLIAIDRRQSDGQPPFAAARGNEGFSEARGVPGSTYEFATDEEDSDATTSIEPLSPVLRSDRSKSRVAANGRLRTAQ
jgi:hypothetical protein